MMITRDFVLKLLPTIEEFIYKHYPNEPIIEDETIHISSSDTQQKQNGVNPTNQEDFSLYKNVESLLVTVNMSFQKETNITAIEFVTKDKTIFRLQANVELLKSILKVIKTSIPKIQWGIAGFI